MYFCLQMNQPKDLATQLAEKMPDLWQTTPQIPDQLPKLKISLYSNQPSSLKPTRSTKRKHSVAGSSNRRTKAAVLKKSAQAASMSSQVEPPQNTCDLQTPHLTTQTLSHESTKTNQNFEPVTPSPEVDNFAELLQTFESAPKQLSERVIVQSILDEIVQQVVLPHMIAVNDCENKLRLILFSKIAVPSIRHVITRNLSVYNYSPTFIQLNNIFLQAFKECGVIPNQIYILIFIFTCGTHMHTNHVVHCLTH